MYEQSFFGGDLFYSSLIIVAVVWSSVWKALALWKAGRQNQKGWFVALFVINTLGILEILYLFVFGKKKIGPVV